MLFVDDIVSYPFGPRVIRARVIEDRGSIGVGGRQLVVIEVLPTAEQLPSDVAGEPHQFEMPAESLTVEQQPAA